MTDQIDDKKSIPLYFDQYENIMDLTFEETGEIVQGLYRFAVDGEIVNIADRAVRLQYNNMKRQYVLTSMKKEIRDEQRRINGNLSPFKNAETDADKKIASALKDLASKADPEKYKGTLEEFRQEYYYHPGYVYLREKQYLMVPQGTYNKKEQKETESKPIETNINELNIFESNTGESNRPKTNTFEKSADITAGDDELLHFTDSELRLEIGKIFQKNRKIRFTEDEGGKLQYAIYQALKGKPLTYVQLESEVVKMIDQNDLPF